jgi:protein SCO1/2
MRRTANVWLKILALAALMMVAGCKSSSGVPAQSATQQYPVRGVVVSVDQASSEIGLDADAIPGLMEAMTMSYKVEDPAALSELHPGDRITATLEAEHDSAGPINMRLKDIVIVAQARPDYKPAVLYHVPEPGDAVPDFKLRNQSGRTIGLRQYRGKVLALTFIYTRCPLSDYCPRMSRNFAAIDKALDQNPKMYGATHLLSVSFDPTFDTPQVLKSYGEAYTGRYSNETFQHWEFATPFEAELPKMEQFFDLGVTPGESGTLQHSLSTLVIGKDGKVVAFYPTNDWTVDEVLAKMKAAAG